VRARFVRWLRGVRLLALRFALLILFGLRAFVASAEEPLTTEQLAEQNRQLIERMKTFDQQMQLMKAQLAAVQATQAASAPEPRQPGDPFAWGDFTWLNGGSRQTSRLLDTKYFTPQLDVDVNYSYSFNHPIDNTVVGSTALARDNELELSFLGLGGDLHVGNVRARLMLQYGTRTQLVPRNDNSALRGQFDLQSIYQYISEAYAGYHIDRMHGINVDVGIFMSYVGLFSYDNFENWAYQPSYTSDNTPWFFNGARIQLFPTDRFKFEIWVINGWQTYGKFNELPGVGYQLQYSATDSMKLVSNGYVGTDTQDHPGRVRFHTDTSFLYRYYNHPLSRGLSRAAFSVTFDVGFEQGDGVVAFHGTTHNDSLTSPAQCTNAHPCEQDFVSGMVYNRLWFYRNRFGWTAGGGFIHNPGRYLVLAPSGAAAPTGAPGSFDVNAGTSFDAWDISTTFDWLPTESFTVRAETVHRAADEDYFAGRGGVTGPDGYKSGGLTSPDGVITTSTPRGWTPDLVRQETRFILALIFRI
jgi:hypothetical protein